MKTLRIRLHPSFAVLLLFGLACLQRTDATAQTFLDKISDSLFLETPDHNYRLDFSGLFDLEGYYIDQRPPGLVFGNSDDFINPRLSLFLDAHAGKHLYSFVQVRIDRGFDPRSEIRDARLDEYLLRYIPFDSPTLNLQVGKFATVCGNWVPRHHSWDNPFINAPLPYESLNIVSDQSIPGSAPAFLARQTSPDKKGLWMPIVWGPSYATGASIFGSLEKWDYAAEIKNSAISSHPESWDARDIGWDHPTVNARIAFRPSVPWTLGASFSYGSYLRPEAESSPEFPPGSNLGDFHQITFGQDISFAWHHWQFWSELFLSRFQVPNVGDADTLSWYLEAKYKITPQLFAALRWNQQFFGNIPNGLSSEQWDSDVWRIDLALGYRFTRHIQGKLQYSYRDQSGSFHQGPQLVAAQLTLKF